MAVVKVRAVERDGVEKLDDTRLTSGSCRSSAEMESFGWSLKSLALMMLTHSPFDAFDVDLRNSITRIFRKSSDCRA